MEERQQTMRGTSAWSYDILRPEERRLFRRLAVFVGGCTLEAAEAVCAGPEGTEPVGIDVLEGLGRLVDQSLLQQRGQGGEPRFGMLHVVREYALQQLETCGEGEPLPPQLCGSRSAPHNHHQTARIWCRRWRRRGRRWARRRGRWRSRLGGLSRSRRPSPKRWARTVDRRASCRGA